MFICLLCPIIIILQVWCEHCIRNMVRRFRVQSIPCPGCGTTLSKKFDDWGKDTLERQVRNQSLPYHDLVL